MELKSFTKNSNNNSSECIDILLQHEHASALGFSIYLYNNDMYYLRQIQRSDSIQLII